ncbi:Trm112 family protein [Paraglaciecola sp. L3A3]|uniref:Trm112 family protein n=1 Tax=Paraglaciecola sp. L3A3 TaxID=2686358 RepID=UPI00131B248A|nr:Trm112 family protein [Paraglaciecola sp. L3A3]
MAFDKKLLDIVACPVCKGKLIYKANESQLICKFDRLVYPIRENIPVLLESEAKQLSSEEIEQLLA